MFAVQSLLVTCLLRRGHTRSNSSCVCAGVFDKCTQRPDQYLAPLTSLLQHSDLHTANSSCICAGVFEKHTQRPDQYLALLTSLLQHSDLHKATSLHPAAHHSGTFPEELSNSPGFCIQFPVQRSLPESRLFSTTALPINNKAGPDISLLSPLLQSQWDHSNNAHLGNIVIKPHSRSGGPIVIVQMAIHTNG